MLIRIRLNNLALMTALSVAVVGVLPTVLAAGDSPPVTIVANPGPFTSIKEASVGEEKVNWWDANLSDDRACTECFAALELARFLPVCTSFSTDDIRLTSPNPLPPTGHVFLIGSKQSNKLIASYNIPERANLKTDESFLIRTVGDKNRTITIIEGKDRVGTLYGVNNYLNHLGIHFYGLGEKGTVYPPEPVKLPQVLSVIENPSFLTRGFWAWEERGNEDFFLWMARNRMNLWTAGEKNRIHFLKKLGMKLTAGGHTIHEYFLDPHAEYPYDHPKFQGDDDKHKDPYAAGKEYAGDTNADGKLTYFEAHPEWYGLRNGKRSSGIKGSFGDNYCTSNADATKELAKNLIQSLTDGRWRHADTVDFWMLDVGKWCECESCRRQGTYTDRLFDVIHTVLTEIHNAHRQGRLQRNVQLVTLAYQETLSPPTRPLPDRFDYANCSVTFFPIQRCYVHPLADPNCTEINKALLDDYQGWATAAGRRYTGPIFIGEYYNVSSIKSLPVLFTKIMAADIPWYYKTGARHFHYMHTPTRLWGTWTLNQYLLARLLWDINTEVNALLEDYFHQYYPRTTDHARAFYRHLEAATANIKPFKHHVTGYSLRSKLASKSAELFPLDHLHYEPYHPKLNDGPDIVEIVDSVRLARKQIEAALLQCANRTEQARLLEDERRFSYGEAMILFYYHLVRTAIFHGRGDDVMARHEFDYVERFAETLKTITDLVQVASSHANAKDGLDATQAVNVYEFFKEKYGD